MLVIFLRMGFVPILGVAFVSDRSGQNALRPVRLNG